ncbi:MAG: CvpA family protein [Myxococcota bacterium]|nr:CvpA family protein [Myxococcota bacterium]
MGEESSLTSLDGIILAILIIAMARGVFIGLVRESFSIAALAAAVLAARYGTDFAGGWLHALVPNALSPQVAYWVAGSLIAIVTVLIVAVAGRILRKGVQFAGLGWADRTGGAALGAAEGLIISLLLVVGATWVLGKDDPAIEHSRSLEAYEVVRSYFSERGRELPDVATPGDWF